MFGGSMRRGMKAYWLATGTVFLVLALLVATDATPGQHPMIYKLTAVLLYPVTIMFEGIGWLGVWGFSEKSKFPFVVCLGVLTFLTSSLYAGAGVLVIRLYRRLRTERIAEPFKEPNV